MCIVRITVACALAALLVACTNLTSVSQFAESGANATSATDVFPSYVDAEANAVRLAYPPTDHPTSTDIAGKEQAQKLYEAAPALANADQVGLKALSLYFQVLASLSSDQLIEVKDSATSISNSLHSLGATSAASVAPASSLIQLLISAPLDAWRNRAVGNLIRSANNDVLQLCSDLSTSAKAVAVVWGADVESASAYYGGIPGPSSDIRGAVMMMALANQEATAFRQQQQKAIALGNVLDNVCSGQKELFSNVARLDLETLQAALNGYFAEIESTTKVLQK